MIGGGDDEDFLYLGKYELKFSSDDALPPMVMFSADFVIDKYGEVNYLSSQRCIQYIKEDDLSGHDRYPHFLTSDIRKFRFWQNLLSLARCDDGFDYGLDRCMRGYFYD